MALEPNIIGLALLQHKRWNWIPAIIGVLIYSLTLGHGFVLDDNLVITRNHHVQEGISAIPTLLTTNYAHGHQGQAFNDGLYRPLSLVSFAIEKSLFNLSPSVSHGLQALLYGLLLLILVRVLERLFQDRSLAFWSSVLFCLHPLHVEVVANLKSRDELFALLFFLWSAKLFMDYLESGAIQKLLFTSLFFLLALFSKESAITFLAVYPLIWWYRKESNPISTIPISLGIVLPATAFLATRYWVLSNMGSVDSGVTGLLQNPLTTTTDVLTRISTACELQWFYFQKSFLPLSLSSDYSYNAISLSTFNNLESWLGLLAVVAGLILAIRGLRSKHAYGWGIAFYFITLSVVSNLIILIGAMAAERFMFTPSLGWTVALVFAIRHLPYPRLILLGFSVFFLTKTALRIPEWKDEFTLFTTDVEYVPESARAHYNAATASNLRAKSRLSKAVQLRSYAVDHFKQAIEIWPDYQDAYNNLGVTYMDSKRYQEAYGIYITLHERFPDYVKSLYNLAVTCYQLLRYSEAESYFEQYHQVQPNADALFWIAETEGYQGKFDEAIEHLNQLIQQEPRRGRGYLKLGMAYAIQGNLDDAERILRQGLTVAPKDAELYMNLAILLYNQGRFDEALIALQNTLSIAPNHQQASEMMRQLQNR